MSESLQEQYNPSMQEMYNIHRLAGGKSSDFKKSYCPFLSRDDLKKLESEWKRVEKAEKKHHKEWECEKVKDPSEIIHCT